MLEPDFEKVIRQKDEEIEEKNCLIEILTKQIIDLQNGISPTPRESSFQKKQSREQRALRQKAYTLDNLSEVLMSINHMKVLEKKGKPLSVPAEDWSKMVRNEKWRLMCQASKELSKVYGFFERAEELTHDAEEFAKAMTLIFEELRSSVQFFVDSGTLFARNFDDDVQNKLYRCLRDGIY